MENQSIAKSLPSQYNTDKCGQTIQKRASNHGLLRVATGINADYETTLFTLQKTHRLEPLLPL